MRTFSSVVVLLTVALVSSASLVAKDPKPKKDGQCDDGHGNLAWESTADPVASSDDWSYQRAVTNRSTDRTCRVVWENGKLKWSSFVPACKKMRPPSITTDENPDEVAGKIHYNGGREAGEAEAKADAWLPKHTAQDSTSATKADTVTDLAFQLSDKIYEGTATASSRLEAADKIFTSMRYSLKIELKDIPDEKVHFRWTSIETDVLRKAFGEAKFVPDKMYLEMKKDGRAFTFEANYKPDSPPAEKARKVNDGSLQIMDKDGNILAEAWVPAIVPLGK
jgi:hypothetical protein